MVKPEYSYNYDHDTDTTTITTTEKINGEIITTTKTVEGNQIPEPEKRNLGMFVLISLGVIVAINIVMSSPGIFITPVATIGALKLAKNKTKLEKTIIGVGVAGVTWFACLAITPAPNSSSTAPTRSNYIVTDDGTVITRERLRDVRIACKKIIKASGSNDTEQCWKYSDQ